MKLPSISVVLPVFNAENFLRPALESVLAQTKQDFELIIINDHSTDSSEKIIKSFRDSRIHLVTNVTNLGVAVSLVKGFKLARAKYIARMDADDISLPQRFEIQYQFMEKNPQVGISGTDVFILTNISRTLAKYPTSHDDIRARLLFRTAFAHPSTIFRRQVVVEKSLYYDPKFKYCEDYELWTRAAAKTILASVPKALLLYRKHNVQRSLDLAHSGFISQVRALYLQRLGLNPSLEQLQTHNLLSSQNFPRTLEFVQKARDWSEWLARQNRHKKLFSPASLERVVSLQVLEVYAELAKVSLLPVEDYLRLSYLALSTKLPLR